jgi:hypothetical protein
MADYADLLAAESTKQPGQKQQPPKKTAGKDTAAAKSEKREESVTSPRHDVTTSSRQDVDYRAWRDIIEDTETRNSSLRITREEGYEIEDLVKELERKHKITTSMNELARLGLLSILHDYKKNKSESLIYKVKKS